MALADPQSVTLGGSAQSLPLIVRKADSGEYLSADGKYRLLISQSAKGGVRRTTINIQRKSITTNPLNDVKSNVQASLSVSLVRPEAGFTDAELTELFTALNTWGSAGANANYLKVIGMQS